MKYIKKAKEKEILIIVFLGKLVFSLLTAL